MEFILKYKIFLLRIIGVLMLVIGFAAEFWVTPKEGFTQSEIAAANVARMEASIKGVTSGTKKAKSTNKYLEELKNKQEIQMRYLTIISMSLGVGFLGYSFMKKKVSKLYS